MGYVSGSYVRRIAQVTYTQFTSGTFASNTELEEFIDTDLLPNAESIVSEYCHKSWTDATAPKGAREAVAQVCVNMLQIMILRKQGPLVKTGDYRIEFAQSDLLTEAIKNILTPFVESGKYITSIDWHSEEAEDEWA